MSTLPPPAATTLPKPRRRWVTLLLALLIFLAGIVVGIGGTVAVAAHRLQYVIHHPEEAPRRITDRLKSRLHLDPRQAAAIQATIAQHQASLQSIRREVQPRVERELSAAVQDIQSQLRPDQAEKWQRLVTQLRAQWTPAEIPTPPPH